MLNNQRFAVAENVYGRIQNPCKVYRATILFTAKLLSLRNRNRKSPVLWSSEISSSAFLATRRDTERYPPAIAHVEI